MKKSLKHLAFILYFGSIWGILEASLGYALHSVTILISGSIMFPIAAVILVRAYKERPSRLDLVWIGMIAAIIKSSNFFLPQLSIWKTINPMISIVVEALMVIAVISLLEKQSVVTKIVALPIASIAWRAVFLFALYVQSLFTGFTASQISTLSNMVDFAIISGLFSGFLATGAFFLNALLSKQTTFQLRSNLALSSALFTVSVALTVVLKLI